jgi:hypothetical protein
MPDRGQAPRDVSAPAPCFVRLRLGGAKGTGPGSRRYVAARVFIDPVSGALAGEIDGAPAPVDEVWLSGDLISEDEFSRLFSDGRRAAPF